VKRSRGQVYEEPIKAGRPRPISRLPCMSWGRADTLPSHHIACQCSLLPAGAGVDFRRQVSFWRSCTGPLGPEGVCWSRRAYRCKRGKGLGVRALAYVPRHCPQAAKSATGSSLMRYTSLAGPSAF
jgi:hypothetical protein